MHAVIFVCYRAGRDRQAQAALDDADSAALQRATIVLSIVPGSAAAAAFAAQQQQPYSSSRPRPGMYPRKTPTPPTIIRNLPVVIWVDKSCKHTHKGSDADDTAQEKDAAAAAGGAPAAASTAGSCSGDSDGSQESLCVICCCHFMAGEAVKLLPCMHMYHQACIDAWLERSHVCPVCQVGTEGLLCCARVGVVLGGFGLCCVGRIWVAALRGCWLLCWEGLGACFEGFGCCFGRVSFRGLGCCLGVVSDKQTCR